MRGKIAESQGAGTRPVIQLVGGLQALCALLRAGLENEVDQRDELEAAIVRHEANCFAIW